MATSLAIVYWIIGLTITTYLGAFIVKRFRNYGYAALVAFYTIYLGITNILAPRLINVDLGFYSFLAPGAVFIFPFTAQIIDMINESYGRKKAHLAVFIVFITQVLLITLISLAKNLEASEFFLFEEAWQNIFNLSIRVIIASWAAILISQNLDVYVFSWLKKKYPKKLILRSVSSDAMNLFLDSIIFGTLAFLGVAPISKIISGQILAKIFIGLVDTPWFVWYKKLLEKDYSNKRMKFLWFNLSK